MTIFSCKIMPQKAYLFTDTQYLICSPGFRKQYLWFGYKPVVIPGTGIALFGVGFSDIVENVKNDAEALNIKSFDVLAEHLPALLRQQKQKKLLSFLEGNLPEGPASWENAESDLKRIVENESADFSTRLEISNALNAKIFALGYSFKKQHMGMIIAIDSGPDNRAVYKIYEEFVFCFQRDKVRLYWQTHYDENLDTVRSPEKLIEALKISTKYHKQFLKEVENFEEEKIALLVGGEIDLTTLYADGSMDVRKMGPLVDKNDKGEI